MTFSGHDDSTINIVLGLLLLLLLFVMLWVCLFVVCQHYKMKTPDRNDLKLDTIVVLDTKSKSVDLGFKGQCHRIIILNSLHTCGTDATKKFKYGALMYYGR